MTLHSTHTSLDPSAWVRRFAALTDSSGRVLDLACGSGRHARLLASMGYHVDAVDRDVQAVAGLNGLKGIEARVADLEQDTWPFVATYAGVIVTNYLYRPRFDALLDLLQPGGVLIYETFMAGHERLGRPTNPDFLLQPHELLDRVRPRLHVVAFEQGRIDEPKPAFVQRICAVNSRDSGTLPRS